MIQSHANVFDREFVLATQITYPPTSGSTPTSNTNNTYTEPKSGTNILSFDNSGTLLASRTENMPTTLWIWDVSTRILRAVLIFHSSIAKATWHPTVDELILVRCEGDESRSLIHLWDPSWTSPRIVNFAPQLVGGKVIGKTIARWMAAESCPPVMFISDSQDCILASLAESNYDSDQTENLPWKDANIRGMDIYGQQEESPLSLVPANEKLGRMDVDEESFTAMSGGSEEVDDTFRFKKFVPAPNESSWT